MGNANSVDTSRRTSQRLSKPKTGNHATAGPLSPVSFSNSSRPLSNAPLPNPPPPSTVASTPTTSSAVEVSGSLGRRVDSLTSLHSVTASQRQSKRRSLFRSRSSRPADRNRQSHGGGSASYPMDGVTRDRAMTYESATAYYGQSDSENRLVKSASRTSWNYNLTSYEAKRLLNLDEDLELGHAATMSENRATAVTDDMRNSSQPPQPPSAPITRASSDVSLYMPVRRRSIIQTPGVATRASSTRDFPPLPQPSFRHSHPPTPSLSRQQSVESYRSGVMSMPPPVLDPESMPRVVTPCEDRYLSIGAFKLGSLRITNGSPSPLTPEVDRTRGSAGPAIGRDGYFSGPQAPEAGTTTASAAQDPGPLAKRTSSSSRQSEPTSPALQTTSKATAVEDQLFDDEAQPEFSSAEILDVRLDPNAKAPHAKVEPDARSVTRTDSGFVSEASPVSEVSHKPLSKADSGYSSNVSLRSLQAKSHVADNQTMAASVEKQLSQSSSLRDATVASERESSSDQSEVPDQPMSEEESPPPPVPPKDSARYPSNSQPNPNRAFVKRPADETGTNSARPTIHALKPLETRPSGHRGPASPGSDVRSPVSVRSSTSDKSSSASSGGRGSQRPGRLQRLLSGVRRPAPEPVTIQTSHAVAQDGVPPVPREAEHRLAEHTGRFPLTARRLALKSRSSMDTLKTIFSVGSIEASLEAVNSMQAAPTGSESEGKEGLWKQTLHSVPSSIANVAAHIIPRKPITRKPVPLRQESLAERRQEGSSGQEDVARGVGSAADADDPRTPTKWRRRAMSLTTLGERAWKLRHRASEIDLTRSPVDLPSSALPSPVAKALSSDSDKRTSQPASTSRRPPSLRVPPPLRSQSSTASLSRKASRESMQSHPALHPLGSKTSMDSLRSYASTQPGAGSGSLHSRSNSGISLDPRRLQSFRQYQNLQSPYNSPKWDAQTDNGIVHRASQTFATSGSRRNSITSVQSEGGYYPASSQNWQVRTPQQPLRHRASYDGYSYHQRFPQYGYPPSMSNGYTAPVKPVSYYDPRGKRQLDAAATWSRSQADAAAGQWYQGGGVQHPHPPYVPRGHYRNRSMGVARGSNPPYRVLHSYNSPAYRNAPIWG